MTMPSPVAYTPIGFGKPLSVEIMTIYTGAFKKKGLFAGLKNDVLCVSGVKAEETFDATPRAINLLASKTAENSFLDFSAFTNGTRYVYYKEAVDTDSLEITIELSANSFMEDICNTLSGLLTKAAGLPVFMPAEGKLLAGSQLVNLLSAGAKDLFAPTPFFNETLTIQFDTAGLPVNTAQSILLCREEDKATFNNYQINNADNANGYSLQLTDGKGNIYSGDAPYIILNIDGADKPALQTWTATIASSGLLSRFYGDDDSMEGLGEVMQQAMALYNDYNYRAKAALLLQQSTTTQPGSSLYNTLKAQYSAALANIKNNYFKTGLPAS